MFFIPMYTLLASAKKKTLVNVVEFIKKGDGTDQGQHPDNLSPAGLTRRLYQSVFEFHAFDNRINSGAIVQSCFLIMWMLISGRYPPSCVMVEGLWAVRQGCTLRRAGARCRKGESSSAA